MIRVKAKASGEKVNRANVSSDTADSNRRNNSDTAITVVRPKPAPSADLSIEKYARPGPVTVGRKLLYTLTVRNRGPDAATGVVIKDNLPAGTSFVSASRGCKSVKDRVRCKVGRLKDGASATKKIKVLVEEAGRLRNTATVRSGVGDPISKNDSDTEITTARPERDGHCTQDQPNTSSTSALDGCGRKPQASTSNQEVRNVRQRSRSARFEGSRP